MKIEKIQLFDNKPNVTLTSYILDDSPEILNGKKRPAVLICPGGAYMFCSDREAEPIALRFAGMGYHAFVLRYSVYSNSGAGFAVPGKTPAYTESIQPVPMQEIGTAILKIREHSKEWLVDMDKIILTGYSAGAHNCAMFATHYDKPEVCGALGCSPEEIRPAAAFLGYGFYDVEAFEKSLLHIGDKQRYEMNKGVNFAFSGHDELTKEDILFMSPAKLVSESTPPMFLWSTGEDNTVPVSQTTRMATALAENDIPFEVHIFEKGDHGLALADWSSAAAKEQMNEDVAQWTMLADKWLQKRFQPDIPDTLPKWEMPEE